MLYIIVKTYYWFTFPEYVRWCVTEIGGGNWVSCVCTIILDKKKTIKFLQEKQIHIEMLVGTLA